MSQRGKRQPNRTEDGQVPAKRRKCRPTAAEEEEAAALAAAAIWTPRPLNDLKISSIYNRSATEAPAELFRKDLISAMKLPDSEPLSQDEYWVISDQWKQEWERGVQVPVNPDSLPEPTVTVNKCTPLARPHHDFKLPKSKYIRITKDEFFSSEEHYLSNTPAKAEKACSYDLDDADAAWLQILNGERATMGLQSITETQLERVMEELEVRCWEKVQTIVKTEEGLGIEYDENVICDVCRSPDSEEGNEMVFCDCCNICVHQACYGITAIPPGSWLCRTCSLGQRPECVLCPNKGGAMKCTRSGQKWAHVSCALWIPEVSIGCVERMEPITKISSIPQSRWALICVLCRERVGACIQCSVKTCKTAYHVTCAFKHGLEMRAIIEDENADDGVKLRSYCQKHSVTSKKERSDSASEDEDSKRKKRKDMTSEEKNQARAAKLQEIEAEFDKHVSVKDVTQHVDVDPEGIHFIYNYWKLKRKTGFNKPLLPPKSEDVDILSQQQEQADLEKMKMFVQLRQDLERVRNLCYMVSRREKLSRSFFRMREQTFHKQVAVLSDTSCSLKGKEVAAVIEANHGPSIYDRLYSQPTVQDHTQDFDLILARIAGIASPTPLAVDEKGKTDLNGLVKCPSDKRSSLDNPYKRLYFNGASRRRSSLYGGSMSSGSETDLVGSIKLASKTPGRGRVQVDTSASSTEDEKPPTIKNRKNSSGVMKPAERKRNKKVVSQMRLDTSSEEDKKPSKTLGKSPRSKTLRQMERELGDKLGSATDDSDELLPIKPSKNEPHKINKIYSDSDSEVSIKAELSEEETNEDNKSPSNTPSDSQQHVLRTKGAMKEFSAGLQPKVNKSGSKNNSKPTKLVKKSKDVKEKDVKEEEDEDEDVGKDYVKEKEHVKSSKKKEYGPTELIVPQRQAAKKATESIRCSQGRTKEQILFEQEALKTPPPPLPPPPPPPPPPQPPQPLPLPLAEEPKVVKQKVKKSKESKGSKDGKFGDIYDFEKDPADQLEILAYVPQRQAAKKAAAHIKSGMTKPATVEGDLEGGKGKKELVDVAKTKKEIEIKPMKESENDKNKSAVKSPDSKSKSTSKSKTPVSTSSSSASSSDDSSSSSISEDNEVDEQMKKKPGAKSPKKDIKSDKEHTADKMPRENLFAAAILSKDVDKKSKVLPEKRPVGKNSMVEWTFPEKSNLHSSTSCSSSSDDDSDENSLFGRKSTSAIRKDKVQLAASKSKSSPRGEATSSKTKAVDSEEEKSFPGTKSVSKKFKKAPDKKLKTSDRRPELEFQPPIVERSESFRAKEKLAKGRKSSIQKLFGESSGDWVGNTEGKPGTQSHDSAKERDSHSKDKSVSKTVEGPPGKRNRLRTPRIEEQSKQERERESDRGKGLKKVQTKLEGRKRKSSEINEPAGSSDMCSETVGLSRGPRTAAELPTLKEKVKPNEHVPTSIKKAEKKLEDVEEDSLGKEGRKPNTQHKNVDRSLADVRADRISLTSTLEREIAERKAEKAEKISPAKRSSRLSIDQLFEKRDKKIDKLFDKKTPIKEISSQIEKPSSKQSINELSLLKDSKDDAHGKDIQKSSKETTIQSKEKLNRFKDFTKKVSPTRLESPKRILKEKESVEKLKTKEVFEEVRPVNKLIKPNSVIISNKESYVEIDTVIRKIEKPSLEINELSVKKIERKKSSTDSKRTSDSSEVLSSSSDNRRDSSESTSSMSTDNDEDPSKKKAKPMPRCKKKALGILTEPELAHKDKPIISKDEKETLKEACEVETVSDESKVRAKEEVILDTFGKIENNEIIVLSPNHASQSDSIEIKCKQSNGQTSSISSNGNSFNLIPNLEKALDIPTDFQVTEPESIEPKKITSRTSSVNAPSYQQRSIFSPQQPSKDAGVAELFDFENEILAVDETVNDDGFGIARDTEENFRAPPLSFSFNSEFLFKEDSKEDSARETLNLVEKLRLEYAKKSTNSSSHPDAQENIIISASGQDDSVIQLDDIVDEKLTKPPSVIEILDPSPQETKDETSVHEVVNTQLDNPTTIECTVNAKMMSMEPSISLQEPHESIIHHHTDDHAKNEIPQFPDPYSYPHCSMQMEENKVAIPGREKLDRSSTAQADERWVPPSIDFMPHQHLGSMMQHHYETLNQPSMDCVPPPSPYTELRARAKWADSEVLPARRSSSSSASSSSSSSHREDMEPLKRDDLHLPSHTSAVSDISLYPGLHPSLTPYPPCALSDATQYHPYSEASPFVGPVALFPPCAQLPFSSPGPTMFAPPFVGPTFQTTHSLMASVVKPLEEPPMMPQPCVAAFTSSSHNMALTAAMVSPPPVSTPSLLPPEQSPGLHSDISVSPAQFVPVSEKNRLPTSMSPVNSNQNVGGHLHSTILPTPILSPTSLAAPLSSTSLPPTPLPSALLTPTPLPPTSHPPTPVPPPTPTFLPPSPMLPTSAPPTPAPTTSLPSPVSVSTTLPPPPPSPVAKSAANTTVGKKSPAKPTRTSARFISQQGKSPGKSPRQQEVSAGKTATQSRVRESGKRGTKVSVNRAMYNQSRGGRGRGRGRGRGHHVQHYQDSNFLGGNTIHSNLVGTVYDFDDDSQSESVENLRAMRERRRSTDIHERKPSYDSFLSRDSSPTSRFTSPPHHVHNSKLRTSYGTELRSPSTMSDIHSSSVGDEFLPPPSPMNNASADRMDQFPDVVQPLLPGPVDMRTYSSSYEPQPSNNPAAYHNNLFATSTAEQHVSDIVEDLDNELHSASAAKSLMSLKSNIDIQKPPGDLVAGALLTESSANNKVSLCDSRNQLKVKIKGPFLDANYSASTVASLAQQAPLPVVINLEAGVASGFIPTATTAISSAASSSGTSNLRRMRKKELLRQYCSQDMNMDDPTGASVTGQAVAPVTAPPVSRTIITIPKAVASMTTIPTREDYKAVVDANMEKKRRKEKSSLSTSLSVPRKMRHLDSSHLANDLPERRRSIGSSGGNASSIMHIDLGVSSSAIKSRGKTMKPSGSLMVLAPKLKIKIGNSIAQEPETLIEEKRLRVRPPKKRLPSIQKPSVEELKRESMKFRRRIMADFDEAEKKHNKTVSGKKRKQRHSDSHLISQIIADGRPEKLIMRINRASVNNSASASNSVSGGNSAKSASGEGSANILVSQTDNAASARTAAPPPQSNESPSVSGAGKEFRHSGATAPVVVSQDVKSGSILDVRTSKVTPIRLKIARCQEGYMMKTQTNQDAMTPTFSEQSQNSKIDASNTTIPVSKGCEVR